MPPSVALTSKRLFVASSTGLVFPAEVLGDVIFLACGNFCDRPDAYDDIRNTFLLVCKAWYRLVAQDARFWSGLYVDRTTGIKLVNTTFRRARGRPVHLHLNARTHILGQTNFDQNFDVLRPVLDRVVHQIGRLTVDATDRSGAETLFKWMEASHGRNVRHLELIIGTSNPPNPFLVDRDLLAFSTLDTMVQRFSHLLIPHAHASTLRRLHLGPVPRSRCEHCWEDIILFLEECVQVTHLVLDNIQCGDSSPPGVLVRTLCSMPSVTHLAFICDSYGGSGLWTALRVPNVRVLEFVSPSTYVDLVSGADPDMFNPSLCDVEVLALRMPIPSTLAMKNILANYPRLVRLDLRRCWRTTVLALVDMRPFVSAPLCPHLLSIHVGNQLSTSQVIRVIGG
ncbi:hypothetical protein R3P38DRAFT_3224407 [Favolaschia claudopus]|uniref:F-box domain-containing protein n=1 Tax=Favolaschia claudopus TaxID=2862362 RepID=A0AAV9ZVZ5_9AGAR